jgi:hypothetical protein
MVSLSSINIYCSYLIEASAVKVCVLPHGHGELPTINVNVVWALTKTVSPWFKPPLELSSVYVTLTFVVLGLTPGEQQTTALISLIFTGVTVKGHVTLPHGMNVPSPGGGTSSVGAKPGVGVTTATLAPDLTAFFREFFVYHALENSVMPNRISSNRKSTKAVSIKV